MTEKFGPYRCEGLGRSELTDNRVLAAMSRVPREKFVPQALRAHAYEDRPLPIGHGQTISQPFMVAFMTQEAQIKPRMRVLEIGTGSGYQAAVLAELGAELVTLEILPEVAQAAQKRLADLGYGSVEVLNRDGSLGYPTKAPYDAILVTAAGAYPPKALLEQLRDGGVMVMPIRESDFFADSLVRFTKLGEDASQEFLMSVAFVPLTGKDGIDSVK